MREKQIHRPLPSSALESLPRPLREWYKFAAPVYEGDHVPNSLVRRGRVVSLLILSAIISVSLGFLDVQARPLHRSLVLVGVLVIDLFAFYLNRRGYIKRAGEIVTLTSHVGLYINVLGGTFEYDLSILLTALMVLGQTPIFTVSFVRPVFVFLSTAINILIVVLLVSFEYLPVHLAIPPCILYLTVCIVAYIWVEGEQAATRSAEMREREASLAQAQLARARQAGVEMDRLRLALTQLRSWLADAEQAQQIPREWEKTNTTVDEVVSQLRDWTPPSERV